jgi:predicted enzyme related to lactoylglutathione lyase
MARAVARCKCKKCGEAFTREKKCYNRNEADRWESWAEANFDLCGQCYAKEQKEREAAKDMYVDVRINSTAAFYEDIVQRGVVAIVFGGDTKSHKDEIKALSAHWTTDYPDNGVLGDLLGMSYKEPRWTIFCGLEELDEKLKQIEKLGAKLNSIPSDVDMAMYNNIINQRRKEVAEKEKKKCKAFEELGEIPAWPDDINTIWPKGATWNCKFYGKPGSWSVYFSGEKIQLTDDQKKRMEEVYKTRIEWKAKKNEIEQNL